MKEPCSYGRFTDRMVVQVAFILPRDNLSQPPCFYCRNTERPSVDRKPPFSLSEWDWIFRYHLIQVVNTIHSHVEHFYGLWSRDTNIFFLCSYKSLHKPVNFG